MTNETRNLIITKSNDYLQKVYIKIEYFNYNINCDNTDNTVRYVFISSIITLCIIFNDF